LAVRRFPLRRLRWSGFKWPSHPSDMLRYRGFIAAVAVAAAAKNSPVTSTVLNAVRISVTYIFNNYLCWSPRYGQLLLVIFFGA
jgi:hypothetical protein